MSGKPFRAFSSFDQDVLQNSTPLRQAITMAYRQDEPSAVHALLASIDQNRVPFESVNELAIRLVGEVREQRTRSSGVDALMNEFPLSSDEGAGADVSSGIVDAYP